MTATLHTQGTNFLPGRRLCTLNNPTWIEADYPSTFTAPADCPTLDPNGAYFFVVERTGNTAGEIKVHGTFSQADDFANPGWNVFGSSARFDGSTWSEEALFIHLIEVRAEANFPVTQLLWSGEIEPTCPPVFESCGYFGSGGGDLTNSQFNHSGATYRVKQLTWWEDDDFGYVKLVLGANNAAKNRAAALAGKFSDFDYLRVAWGEAARDDPYDPDFEFGADETEPNPRTGLGAGRYNSVNNEVTFVWKMSKDEYSNRGLKYAGNHYPIYVQLRK